MMKQLKKPMHSYLLSLLDLVLIGEAVDAAASKRVTRRLHPETNKRKKKEKKKGQGRWKRGRVEK